MNITFETAKYIMDDQLIKKKICSTVDKLYCEDDECKNIYKITSDRIGEDSINGVVYKTCLEKNCKYVAKWQSNKQVAMNEYNMQKLASTNNIAPKIRQVLACPEGIIIIMDIMAVAISRLFKILSKEQLQSTIKSNLEYFDNVIENTELKIDYDKNSINSVEDLRKLRATINKVLFSTGNAGLNDVTTNKDTSKQQQIRVGYIDDIFALIDKLHSLGVSHNDAHLNNFMTDLDGNIKIIDFGTAKEITTHDDVLVDYKRVQRDIVRYYEEGYTNLDYLVKYINTRIVKLKNNIYENKS